MSVVRATWRLVSLRVKWELFFRLDALFGFLGGLVEVVAGVLLFEAIYGRVRSIAGWSRGEAMALVGTLAILLELERTLLRGLHHLPGAVEEGDLELFLTRPVPTPLLLAFHRMNLRALWRLPLGAGALAYGLSLIPALQWPRLPLYLLSLGLSLAIYGLMVFCLVCTSFWIVRVNNLFWLVYDLAEFARYPAGVYRGAVRFLLTTLLPLVVLSNFPVMVLVGRGGWGLIGHQLGVLSGFAALGWGLWRAGLRRYQGAGG